MDISEIKAEEVSTQGGVHTGNPDAPVKLVEFLNVNCPYCKQWYEQSKDTLQPYIDGGTVERITKLFDKDKPSLRKGNILHAHLDYSDPQKAMDDIGFFMERQAEWGYLEDEEVARYALEKRGLSSQPNEAQSLAVVEEAERANVKLVPSVFIGEHIFDEHVTVEELQQYIENELEKSNN